MSCRLAWSMKLLERCMAYMAGVAARSQDARISRMRSPVGRPEKAALSTAVLNGQNLDPSGGMVGLYPLTALSQVASMTRSRPASSQCLQPPGSTPGYPPLAPVPPSRQSFAPGFCRSDAWQIRAARPSPAIMPGGEVHVPVTQ